MCSRFVLLVIMLYSCASFAQEGFMLDLNAFYFQKEEHRSSLNDTLIKYDSEYMFLGLGICYRTGPWCFGGKYLRGEIGSKNDSGFLDGSIELEGLFGLSVGYIMNGFVAQASYFFEAEKRLGDAGIGGDTTIEYPAKQGLMFDLGYGFNIGSTFFGPMVKWFRFRYDKRTVGGQEQSLVNEEKDEYILPMFSIWNYF